jgi:hypothetical protein
VQPLARPLTTANRMEVCNGYFIFHHKTIPHRSGGNRPYSRAGRLCRPATIPRRGADPARRADAIALSQMEREHGWGATTKHKSIKPIKAIWVASGVAVHCVGCEQFCSDSGRTKA